MLLGEDTLPALYEARASSLSLASASSSGLVSSVASSKNASRVNTSMSTVSNDDLNNSINLLIRPIISSIDPIIPPIINTDRDMPSLNYSFDSYNTTNDNSNTSSNGMSKQPSIPIAIEGSNKVSANINQTTLTKLQHHPVSTSASALPLTKATLGTIATSGTITTTTVVKTSPTRINLREIQAIKLLKLRKERGEMDNIRSNESFILKNKVKKTGGHNLKLRGKGDEFMMDETQRRNKFEKAVLKKVDRKNNILKKMLSTKIDLNKDNNNSSHSTNSNNSKAKAKVGNEKMILARRLSISSYDMSQDQINDYNNNNNYNNNITMNRRNMDGTSIIAEDDELTGVKDHYFGNISRINFNRRFLQANKNLQTYPDDDTLPFSLSSPRSLYLREITKLNILPLPLILRKEKEPLGIFLSHRGLGDIRFQPILKIIDQLPGIHTIDLCDNRLTDRTLMTLALKLNKFKNLIYLDLSYNKIDESSLTIMSFIRNPECQLETLLLNGADVDDYECCNIAEAISYNYSIKTLGLSKNLIGASELLNVLHPNLITGGEAIGSMLLMNKTLTELDLSWNSIRLESAIAIAQPLENNSTLVTLLLGYNSFGDMPSQILGRSLKLNKGLTHLDIESNSITPKAATVLANAISFNETLLKLNINGNTLGKIGAQALVAAIQRSSRENRALQVSFINCDCVLDEGRVQ